MFGEDLLLIAGVAGGGYPSLTLTSPTFDTSAPKWGAAALASGSGACAVPNSGGGPALTLDGWVRSPSCPSFQNPFLSINDGTNYAGLVFSQNNGFFVVNSNGSTGAYAANGSQGSSAWRYFCLQIYSGNSYDFWIDTFMQGSGALTFAGATTINLAVAMANGLTGLDSLRLSTGTRQTPGASGITPPSADLTRDGATLALFKFDASNGDGS